MPTINPLLMLTSKLSNEKEHFSNTPSTFDEHNSTRGLKNNNKFELNYTP